MDNESCESCRFVLREQKASPRCRRFPPQCYVYLDGNDETDGCWALPLVEPGDWCGEYARQGDGTTKQQEEKE